MLVLGNIAGLIGSIFMVLTGLVKKKKRIIFLQAIEQMFFIIGCILLGSVPGAITNALSFVIIVFCYNNKLEIKEKILFTILSIGSVVYFNNIGIIGYLPLISTVVYLWLMTIKDIIKFKYLVIFCMILWTVHDFYIKAYTSTLFDIGTIIASFIAIIMIKNKKNKRKRKGK